MRDNSLRQRVRKFLARDLIVVTIRKFWIQEVHYILHYSQLDFVQEERDEAKYYAQNICPMFQKWVILPIYSEP